MFIKNGTNDDIICKLQGASIWEGLEFIKDLLLIGFNQ